MYVYVCMCVRVQMLHKHCVQCSTLVLNDHKRRENDIKANNLQLLDGNTHYIWVAFMHLFSLSEYGKLLSLYVFSISLLRI